MKTCIIFGGSGFVGEHLTKRLLSTGRFDHVHIADIRPTSLEGKPGVSYSLTDVRDPIPLDLIETNPDWIFDLAAIHREPGHEPYEYYATNLPGARHICEYADKVACDNIYFTSSISVYGPTNGPTEETSPIKPITAYGGSKYPAEVIHDMWRGNKKNRRLIISRPGVLYGPGDPGNIMRMIKAIHKGYFAFPGSPAIYKSYGYIYGLLDSIEFTMDRTDDLIVYNYTELPTQPLNEVVDEIKSFLHCRALVVPLPLSLLLPAAKIIQKLLGNRNPVHPVRVKKAATPTHIIPGQLQKLGFDFKYDFTRTLEHWIAVAPEDFAFANISDTTRTATTEIAISKVRGTQSLTFTKNSETATDPRRVEPGIIAEQREGKLSQVP